MRETELLPRPSSVAFFETVSIGALALEIVSGTGVAAGSAFMDLLWLVFMLALILAVSRRRSLIARLGFTALYGIGFVGLIFIFSAGHLAHANVTPMAWLLMATSVVQLALLWSGTTTRWLQRFSPDQAA